MLAGQGLVSGGIFEMPTQLPLLRYRQVSAAITHELCPGRLCHPYAGLV